MNNTLKTDGNYAKIIRITDGLEQIRGSQENELLGFLEHLKNKGLQEDVINEIHCFVSDVYDENLKRTLDICETAKFIAKELDTIN